MKNAIKTKIKEAPNNPGVYQFFDDFGNILYIGKAKNLKNRIRSYYLKNVGRGPGIDLMLTLACDIKYISTESEIEAILLEADLINQIKPKYNIRLRDDKSFLVIKISKTHVIPCVELARFKNVDFKDKSALYFGPYPSGDLLKRSLKYLRKIFPFRDCSENKYKTYSRKGRACLYGDIGICSVPCIQRIEPKDYKKNINYLIQFLKGRKRQLIVDLSREMKVVSKKLEFEKAKKIRDKLLGLEHIKDVAVGLKDEAFDPSGLIFKRIECYDISNIGQEYAVGSMVVFTDGKPNNDEYRKFKIKSQKLKGCESDLIRLNEVLERRFKNEWPLPDLVVIDGGEQQLAVAKKVLRDHNLDIPLISIAKGAKRQKNEFHYSDSLIAKYFLNNKSLENICIAARDEAHRFAISYYRKLHLKDMIKK